MATGIGIVVAILALAAIVWYTVRRATETAQIESDSEQKTEWISRLEKQKLETEQELRAQEKKERDEIVNAGDTARAGELLRDAFKGRN